MHACHDMAQGFSLYFMRVLRIPTWSTCFLLGIETRKSNEIDFGFRATLDADDITKNFPTHQKENPIKWVYTELFNRRDYAYGNCVKYGKCCCAIYLLAHKTH